MTRRQAEEKALKKIGIAFKCLEEGDYVESDRLFRVSEIYYGQALVAFHEKRYERAINKSIKSLNAGSSEGGELEDTLIALSVIKKSRDALISDSKDTVRQGLLDEADFVLASFGSDRLSRAREYVRKNADAHPSVFGPLCDRRSNIPMSERLLVGAFTLLVTTENYHRAGEMVRTAYTVSGIQHPAYTLLLCPMCFRKTMDADSEHRDDALRFRKIVLSEVDDIKASQMKSREESLICAVSLLNFAQSPGVGRDRQMRMATLAGELIDGCSVLPSLRKKSIRGVETDFKSCLLFLRGRQYDLLHQPEKANEYYGLCARSGFSSWSYSARDTIEQVECEQKEKSRVSDAGELRRRAVEARNGNSTSAELEVLLQLRDLVSLNGEEETRFRLLTVMTGRDQSAAAVMEALKYNAENAELINVANTIARRLAEDGELKDFLLLSSRIITHVRQDSEFQELFAKTLERSGRIRAASRTYLQMSESDCSFLPEAIRCCRICGDRKKALFLLSSWQPALCGHARHRMLLYLEAHQLRNPDLAVMMAEAWLDSEPGNADAHNALKNAKLALYETGRELMKAMEKSATEASGRGEWGEAARLLGEADMRFLSHSGISVLADAMEHTGRYDGAVRLHRLLGDQGNIEASMRCNLLRENFTEAYTDALTLCAHRSAEAKPAGDASALCALARGDFGTALRDAKAPGILRLIAEKARLVDDLLSEYSALIMLLSRGAVDRERLSELEGMLPIAKRAHLDTGGRRILLCDTNVMVFLALRKLGRSSLLGFLLHPRMVETFDRLSSGSIVPVVPGAVKAEFLALVSNPPGEGTEEEMSMLLNVADELIDEMDLRMLVGREAEVKQEHMEKARNFFSLHSQHLNHLTRVKAEKNPHMAARIMLRRGYAASRNARKDEEPAVEPGDIRLLSEALSLFEMPLPGFSSVAILTEDRDFRDLRDSIRTAFGIDVYG